MKNVIMEAIKANKGVIIKSVLALGGIAAGLAIVGGVCGNKSEGEDGNDQEPIIEDIKVEVVD